MTASEISCTARVHGARQRGLVASTVWRCLQQPDFTDLVGGTPREDDGRTRSGVHRVAGDYGWVVEQHGHAGGDRSDVLIPSVAQLHPSGGWAWI